jgi:hypothetical protein
VKASPEACAPANPTSFAILFIAANNLLQSPSAEDDVLSSAGRDQIAADEDEREQHQDEIERVHRQRHSSSRFSLQSQSSPASEVWPLRSLNSQLRKGAWLQRSFTLSTINPQLPRETAMVRQAQPAKWRKYS